MNLLTVIPFHAGDAYQVEALLDYVAVQREKQPRGAVLLVAFPDVHAEMTTKLRISAEIGFESVDLLALPWQKVPQTSKVEAINQLWHQAALHIAQAYRTPFVVLEPDTVPLVPSWCEALASAYEHQSKRYMGAFLKGYSEQLFLSRVAVYPPGAIADIGKWCCETTAPLVYSSKATFEITGGDDLVKRASKTRLIQSLSYHADANRAAVREDAVLLHSDKEGVLLSAMRDSLKMIPACTGNPFESEPVVASLAGSPKRGPGRPKKVQEAVNA